MPAGSEDERKQSIAWTYVGEGFSPPVFVPGTPKQAHIKTMLHEMGTATWWESDVRNEPNTRQLQGEIHLSSDLKPSCACKIFTVEVNDSFEANCLNQIDEIFFYFMC